MTQTQQLQTRARELGITLALSSYRAEELAVYLDDPEKAALPRGVRRIGDTLVSPALVAASAQLEAVQAQARTRCLALSDLIATERRYQAARRLARAIGTDPDECSAESSGGCVPNSYRYSASTSWCRRSSKGWEISRVRATSAPNGNGVTERVYVPLPEDGDDRAAVELLKARTPKGWSKGRRDAGRFAWRW